MKLVCVAGECSNFKKMILFIRAIKDFNRQSVAGYRMPVKHTIVYTGQSKELKILESLFREISIPSPGIILETGPGTTAEQLGNTMIAFEKALMIEEPDWVVVLGDSNTTMACSVAAKKMNSMVCHIEAGLRGGDMSNPREINRLAIDRISDLLLTTDRLSISNLLSEGIDDSKIRFVGNILIDMLESQRLDASVLSPDEIVNLRWASGRFHSRPPLQDGQYSVMALQRPSNIDNTIILETFISFLLKEASPENVMIWLIHEKTLKQLMLMGSMDKIYKNSGIILLEQVSYREMLRLNMGAKAIITDSEEQQLECCILGTPCITLRKKTDYPITLRENGGVCVLAGKEICRIVEEYKHSISVAKKPFRPELWDGKTAVRCMEAIMGFKQPNGEEVI